MESFHLLKYSINYWYKAMLLLLNADLEGLL